MTSMAITMAILTHPLQLLLAGTVLTRLARMALGHAGEGRSSRWLPTATRRQAA